MSLGEDRVRVTFNPSEVGLVDLIKQKTAELIDLCNDGHLGCTDEGARCWSLAMTAYEEAAMWAVKAATGRRHEQEEDQASA